MACNLGAVFGTLGFMRVEMRLNTAKNGDGAHVIGSPPQMLLLVTQMFTMIMGLYFIHYQLLQKQKFLRGASASAAAMASSICGSGFSHSKSLMSWKVPRLSPR